MLLAKQEGGALAFLRGGGGQLFGYIALRMGQSNGSQMLCPQQTHPEKCVCVCSGGGQRRRGDLSKVLFKGQSCLINGRQVGEAGGLGWGEWVRGGGWGGETKSKEFDQQESVP